MNKLNRAWKWIKNLWEFYDFASKALPAVVVLGAVIAAVLRMIGHWGQVEILIPRWLVVGLWFVAIGSLVVAIWRFVVAVRASNDVPFNIYDIALDHLWRLNINPVNWIEHDLKRDLPSQYLDAVLSGPFHSAKGCAASLVIESTDAVSGMRIETVQGRCERCQLDMPLLEISRMMRRGPRQRDVQRAVLEELQRLHRMGKKIQSGMKIDTFDTVSK